MIGTISTWIMSIAGVILLSAIVELILPNGQINRYIKGVFSFIIVLVIIMPIPKLLNIKLDLSNVFNSQEIILQEDYLYQINLDKIMKTKEGLEKEIDKEGYGEVVVSINADIFANQVEIKSIYVDISKIVIKGNAAHKDIVGIRYDIVNIIQKNIQIKEGQVLFNE